MTGPHPVIARARIVVEPDPNDSHLYFARCLHCDWTKGPTAKTWLTGTENPIHRREHTAGLIPAHPHEESR